MANLNRVILQGRLTASPDLRTTNSGAQVVSFTVASNKYVKDSDHPQANFVECVAWNQRAELLSKFFDKGSPIIVEGELSTRTYEAKDGSKRKATEVIVNNIYFDGKKGDGGSSNSGDTSSNSANADVDVDETGEPLPF